MSLIKPYRLSVSACLEEAWLKTKGVKTPMWFGLGIIILLTLAGMLLLITVSMVAHLNNYDRNMVSNIASLVLRIFITPLFAGILMMGIKRSVDQNVSGNMIFSYYNAWNFWNFLGFMVCMTVVMIPADLLMMLAFANVAAGHDHMGASGIIASIIAICYVIYMMPACSQASNLIVERRCNCVKAIAISIAMVTKQWLKVFALQLVMLLLMAIISIVFFIGIETGLHIVSILGLVMMIAGLVWIAPMGLCLHGIIYREMFGVSEQTRKANSIDDLTELSL